MTRRLFTYIIMLMSISLIGISGLQWYWLTTAYELNESEFDASVAQALKASVDEMERREATAFIEAEMGNEFIPELKVIVNRLSHEAKFNTDTEIVVLDSIEQHEIHQEVIVWTGESDEKDFEDVQVIAHAGTHPDEGITITQFTSSDTSYCDTVVFADAAAHQFTRIEDVLGQIITTSYYGDKPVSFRLNGLNTDSLVASHLSREGIDIPFSLFLPEDGDPRSENHLANAEYATSLFPTSPELARYQLGLSFPGKGAFVLSAMSKTLALVIGFTLIMLVTFGLTIYYILRQKKISQMKSDFINNMTHELKTPLATIRLAADSIRHPEVRGKDDQVDYFLDVIQSENTRLHSSVENVLQLARMERKELNLEKKSLDINELIHRLAETMDLQVKEKHGTIHLSLDATAGPIFGDAHHLYNAIRNLIDNAIKYSPESPHVRVSTSCAKDGIRVEVRDEGIGMSKEVQSRMFSAFYRAQQGNVHDVKGFGLGLSYVKAIVERHGGTIDVQSSPGKGTLVGIYLPQS